MSQLGYAGNGSSQLPAAQSPFAKQAYKPPGNRKKKFVFAPGQRVVQPGTAGFDTFISTAIRNAAKPDELCQIVLQSGVHLDATQLACVLSRLSQLQSGKALPPQATASIGRAARTCLDLLQQKASLLDNVAFAHVAQSISKLGLLDTQLVAQLVPMYDRSNDDSPSSMTALLTGMAALNCQPSQEWLDQTSHRAWRRITEFTGPELANLMHSLHVFGYQPQEKWLAAAMQAFRLRWGDGCTAPALAKFLVMLVKYHVTPDFNYMTAFLAAARGKMDYMTPSELSAILWASAKATHRPDELFLDCWFRRSLQQMQAYSGGQLVTSLQALATMDVCALPGKFAHASYRQLQDKLGELSGQELASLLWSLAVLRQQPPEDWLETVVSACEAKTASLDIHARVDLAWSLARFQYMPDSDWLDILLKPLSQSPGSMSALQSGLLVWSLSQLQCKVPKNVLQQ